ncbi:hypothetical protein DIPPA_23738 [Diplonema papillatum]|nr:hypothetical protein DIPPA_23738 [Diplonema papillatum]
MADGAARTSKVVGGGISEVRPNESETALVDRLLSEGKMVKVEGEHATLRYSVIVRQTTQDDITRDSLQCTVRAVFDHAVAVFSPFAPDSELSKLNASPMNQPQPVSSDMAFVLSAVDRVHKLTRGAFDPSVAPLTRLVVAGKAGDAAALQQAQDACGWETAWKFTDGEKPTLTKLKPSAAIDLCGISKGWTLDTLADKLSSMGVADAFIDWGGDLKVLGSHPVGRSWAASVTTGAKDAKPFALVDLTSKQGFATSGVYLELEKSGLSHIVDAKTKTVIPVTDEARKRGTHLASVASVSCMLADAFATAGVASGSVDDAKKMLDGLCSASHKAHRVVDYLLYSEDGPVLIQKPWPAEENRDAKAERLTRHEPGTVVVVGGGLAGLSAAIEAANVHAKVILLEKESKTGGNSAKATSGINGWGTNAQAALGIVDDERYFERDTFRSGLGGTTRPGLVRLLSSRSRCAVEWLTHTIGVPLTVVTQLGGAAKPRAHRAPPQADGSPTPIGFVIMKTMRDYIERNYQGKIEVRPNVEVTAIIPDPEDSSSAAGVEYKDAAGNLHQLKADATILCTGGFGFGKGEDSLLFEVRPDLKGVPTTNGSWTDGSGIRLGRAFGADVVDMEHVQLHPTGFVDPKDPAASTKYLGPEALRGSGGVLVNQKGHRFVDELGLRSHVSEAILQNCTGSETITRPFAYCLLNKCMQEAFGRPLLKFYHEKVGLFQAAKTLKDVADHIGCPFDELKNTVLAYNKALKRGFCTATEKKAFPCNMSVDDEDWLVAMVTPAIHYCMGGLAISPSGEVQKSLEGAYGKHSPVKRLFAAGECTGGLHGANRLGGNSLLECVVLGRTVGERAGTIKQKTDSCLSLDKWQPVTFREEKETGEKYGASTRCYRFNLHGALQSTGLKVGQYVALKASLDGDVLCGYFSPITRPYDWGCIDVLSRGDDKGGPIVKLLNALRPGAGVYIKAMGGLELALSPSGNAYTWHGEEVKKLNLIAGGTGIAPMIQIVRSFVKTVANHDPNEYGIRILYAAESSADLAFAESTERVKNRYPDFIKRYVVLNHPPVGWTEGVGFIDMEALRTNLWGPEEEGTLTVLCGPPIFEKITCSNLAQLGFDGARTYSYSRDA